MKSIKKILIPILIGITLYYILSLIFMNDSFHLIHYYTYKDIEEAKQKKGIINENINYQLKGFSEENEKIIKENINIYTTKSNYEEFYGFLIKFKHEDQEMLRINIELNNADGYHKIFDGEVRYKNKYKGLIYGASFDVFRDEKSITLDVIEYQNHKPVKLGEIIINPL